MTTIIFIVFFIISVMSISEVIRDLMMDYMVREIFTILPRDAAVFEATFFGGYLAQVKFETTRHGDPVEDWFWMYEHENIFQVPDGLEWDASCVLAQLADIVLDTSEHEIDEFEYDLINGQIYMFHPPTPYAMEVDGVEFNIDLSRSNGNAYGQWRSEYAAK